MNVCLFVKINNMLEQFQALAKQSKSSLLPFQSHRMHLGAFTEVCVKQSVLLNSY